MAQWERSSPVDWPTELRVLNPSARYHDRHGQNFHFRAMFGQGNYTISGKVDDVEGWLAMEALRQHPDHAHDPNRHGDGVEAVSFTHEVPLSRQAVEMFLHIVTTNTSSGLLRMKGIFALTDDPERPLVAHAVQHRLHPLQRLERWPDADRSSRVVLIGQDMPIKQIGDLFEILARRSARKRRRLT